MIPSFEKVNVTDCSSIKLIAMVQTDISQLSRECNAWRETLRNYRHEFTEFSKRLQEAAGRPLSKEALTEVERYHNQFHIQLINIHDLKQSIKTHDRKIQSEESSSNVVRDATLADHEDLYDQYVRQEQTLQDLRNEFSHFLERIN